MSGFTSDLLTGLAAYLHAAAIGTYKASGAYAATDTAIVLGDIPQDPDNVITLGAYGVSDDVSLSDSVIGVQVRCRAAGADPCPADDMADGIFDLLHGATNLTLAGGVRLVQCLLHSGPASLGQDANGRWSCVQNFYCTVHRPSTNRT